MFYKISGDKRIIAKFNIAHPKEIIQTEEIQYPTQVDNNEIYIFKNIDSISNDEKIHLDFITDKIGNYQRMSPIIITEEPNKDLTLKQPVNVLLPIMTPKFITEEQSNNKKFDFCPTNKKVEDRKSVV